MKRLVSIFLCLVLMVGLSAVGFPYIVSVGATSSKLIAFTFDDGPSVYTPSLLDGLAALNAKVTFFCNGENGGYAGAFHRSEDLLRMAQEGHQLANHTYSHRVPFYELTPSEMRSEVERVNALLYKAIGSSCQTLVRTPGGADSAAIRAAVNAPIILWSVDTQDWKLKDEKAVCDHIVNSAQDGGIVLLHDLYPTSIDGALEAMRILQGRGYEFVTVSELFRRRGVTLENGKVYSGVFDSSVDLPAYQAPTVTTGAGQTANSGRVTVTAQDGGLTLYYTLDGTTPTPASARYTGPLDVPYDTTVTVAGFDRFATRTPLAVKVVRRQYEDVFDAAYYAERYPELRLFCKDDATLLTHFLRYGVHEGRQASPVFSVNYYMAHNPQLKAELGDDRMAYLTHFQSIGMTQGLRGSEEFDPVSYRLQYADLRREYGNDWHSYYFHYLKSGRAEGRNGRGCAFMQDAAVVTGGVDYGAVYNYEYYTMKYPDVKEVYGYDDEAVLRHFVRTGMAEGRQANVRFNPSSYYKQYPDLRNRFGADMTKYYRHYVQNGRDEERRGRGCAAFVGSVTCYDGVDYAAVFDFAYYQEHNPDVRAMCNGDDVKALRHFVQNGMREGRCGSESFDVQSYGYQYPDLRRQFGNDLPKYYRHYLGRGQQEGRQGTGCTLMAAYTTVYNGVDYAAVYDYNEYVTRYPDVKKAYGLNDAAVLRHFVTCGMKEGRQASPLFSAQVYRENYGDLEHLFGDDWSKYFRHYLGQGMKEGRRGR